MDTENKAFTLSKMRDKDLPVLQPVCNQEGDIFECRAGVKYDKRALIPLVLKNGDSSVCSAAYKQVGNSKIKDSCFARAPLVSAGKLETVKCPNGCQVADTSTRFQLIKAGNALFEKRNDASGVIKNTREWVNLPFFNQ